MNDRLQRGSDGSISVQLDDYRDDELRFRVENTLKGGQQDPTMYVKAGAIKKLLDRGDDARALYEAENKLRKIHELTETAEIAARLGAARAGDQVVVDVFYDIHQLAEP